MSNKLKNEAYNLDKLVKISAIREKVNFWYEYKEEIKILGIKFREKGIYDACSDLITPENIYLNYGEMFSEDKKQVLFKPKVVFYFQSGIVHEEYFDRYENALTYVEHFINKYGLEEKMVFTEGFKQ